jgi:hypothetical protein
LPTRGQVAAFPIDHIIPLSRTGTSDLDNLAFSCISCNAHKWAAIEGRDDLLNEMVRLFHPRIDVWNEHFEWSASQIGLLIGKTSIARATLEVLKINSEEMITLRIELEDAGLFTEFRR